MSLEDAMPIALRDALIIIGALCVIAGMTVRGQREASRGFGMSLIVVGAMLIVAGPAGRLMGWW